MNPTQVSGFLRFLIQRGYAHGDEGWVQRGSDSLGSCSLEQVLVFLRNKNLLAPDITNQQMLNEWNQLCSMSVSATIADENSPQQKRLPARVQPPQSNKASMLDKERRILKKIGEGGMGVVYLVEHLLLGRREVVKRLKPGADDQTRQRFIVEAKAMARINHPNVAGIHALHLDQENPGLIIHYIEGQDLKDYLDAHRLVQSDALKIFHDIVRGVAEIHKHNLMHRDLKPANVMVQTTGQAVVLDLGLARSGNQSIQQLRASAVDQPLEGGTLDGEVVGTPIYMAPEQALGDHITLAIDVYALGKIFVEMLTGVRFHPNAKSLFAAMDQVANTNLVPVVREVLTKHRISPMLISICEQMVAFEVTSRYQTAVEIDQALNQFIEAEKREQIRQQELQQELIEKQRMQAEQAQLEAEKARVEQQASQDRERSAKRVIRLVSIGACVLSLLLVSSSLLFAWGKRNAEVAAEQSQKAADEAEKARAEQLARAEASEKAKFIASNLVIAQTQCDASDYVSAYTTLTTILETDADNARARSLIAEVTELLEKPERVSHRLWLAEKSDGTQKQEQYLLAVLGLDTWQDRTPDEVQAQLVKADEIIAMMNSPFKEVASVIRAIFARHQELLREGRTDPPQLNWSEVLPSLQSVIPHTKNSWVLSHVVGFILIWANEPEQALHLINNACTINPNYPATLFHRQRLRRIVGGQQIQQRNFVAAYGHFIAGLQDLERLEVIRKNDIRIQIEHADCLIELSNFAIPGTEDLRLARANSALEFLDSAKRQREMVVQYNSLSYLYAQYAKAYAMRYSLQRNGSDKTKAEEALEKAYEAGLPRSSHVVLFVQNLLGS